MNRARISAARMHSMMRSVRIEKSREPRHSLFSGLLRF
jgi:hypothetical protein